MIELKDRRTGDVRYSFDVENVKDIPNLRVLDLTWIDLRKADLYNTDLSGADLRDADLTRADLTRADLSGADLIGANLYNADLSGADLRDADLRSDNLTGANLKNAKGLTFSLIQFNSMGEKGRTLIYFQNPKDKKMYFQCGCFFGDENELIEYIQGDNPDLKESRLYAVETVKTIMQYNLKGKN